MHVASAASTTDARSQTALTGGVSSFTFSCKLATFGFGTNNQLGRMHPMHLLQDGHGPSRIARPPVGGLYRPLATGDGRPV